jgi:hypothetical protein
MLKKIGKKEKVIDAGEGDGRKEVRDGEGRRGGGRGRGLMTSGGRGTRAYHRHIWKACRGGW